MAKLIIVSKGDKKVFALGDEPFIMGRAPECDFVLDEPKCSRQHCEFAVEDHIVKARDLATRTGTRANV